MQTLNEIKSVLSNEIPFLKNHFHVSSIGLFGSYVRGEQKTESDLDVLVDFNQPVTLFDIVDLEDYLTQKVKVKVDLVMKQALRKRTGQNILKEVVQL